MITVGQIYSVAGEVYEVTRIVWDGDTIFITLVPFAGEAIVITLEVTE